jgi:geranylgeranyl diphosphate synthase type II
VAFSTESRPAVAVDPLRERIDIALGQYTEFDADCPAHLREAIRYALLGPGKRLRPKLVLMAAEVCGADLNAPMPAACAVEMVHAYSLVHDDLPAMDNDDLRRGRPTCHKRFGEAVAILVGDALLARAFEILATELKPTIAAKCCAVLAHAASASALVGGQADDLACSQSSTTELELDLAALESIHKRKTGALFVACLELGATVAEAGAEQVAALVSYGRRIGLAFQITDDLLDVDGNPAAVGKRLAKDANRGKLTFPGLLGAEESRKYAERLVNEACAMIEMFGSKAEPLQEMAALVLSRKK